MPHTVLYARLRDDVGLRRVLCWHADITGEFDTEHISGTLTEVLDQIRTRENNT